MPLDGNYLLTDTFTFNLPIWYRANLTNLSHIKVVDIFCLFLLSCWVPAVSFKIKVFNQISRHFCIYIIYNDRKGLPHYIIFLRRGLNWNIYNFVIWLFAQTLQMFLSILPPATTILTLSSQRLNYQHPPFKQQDYNIRDMRINSLFHVCRRLYLYFATYLRSTTILH